MCFLREEEVKERPLQLFDADNTRITLEDLPPEEVKVLIPYLCNKGKILVPVIIQRNANWQIIDLSVYSFKRAEEAIRRVRPAS